jgi:hypothetical protein
MPPPNQQTAIQVVHPYYKITKGLPSAVVRSYKEPLYDSELIRAASPSDELVLYSKPVGQTLNDGTTRKTLLMTNQNAASQLGTPLSFDVYAHNARLTTLVNKIVSVGNYNLIEAKGVAQVVFGQDTVFLTIPIEDVPSGVDTEGLGATDAPHVGLGVSDNLYRFDIGGRALHINSTENYAVKITFPSGLAGITGDVLFRWYMRGIKYKGV